MKGKITKKDLKVYKKILTDLRDEIIDQIKHISEDTKKSQRDASGDISGYSFHMADVATDTYDREFSLGLASNDRQLLYDIDDAIKKLEDGKFGSCEECGKPITKSRLKAIPYTKLCLGCQKKLER
ncbi:MAG: TraR/DksA family transcriptional regulator [Candidatus Omnitrophica bacterium]|nr:TraR/DksA family transcriptional regulator [Candidatus Omnitrophota bacterium]HOX54420.1 TraR/DksA family transcriptional regulator [Candidatus Omnitrophota bacterium]